MVGREVAATLGSETLGPSRPLVTFAQTVRSESHGEALARVKSSEKETAVVGDSYSGKGNADRSKRGTAHASGEAAYSEPEE